jgi:hypothetical protein
MLIDDGHLGMVMCACPLVHSIDANDLLRCCGDLMHFRSQVACIIMAHLQIATMLLDCESRHEFKGRV